MELDAATMRWYGSWYVEKIPYATKMNTAMGNDNNFNCETSSKDVWLVVDGWMFIVCINFGKNEGDISFTEEAAYRLYLGISPLRKCAIKLPAFIRNSLHCYYLSPAVSTHAPMRYAHRIRPWFRRAGWFLTYFSAPFRWRYEKREKPCACMRKSCHVSTPLDVERI